MSRKTVDFALLLVLSLVYAVNGHSKSREQLQLPFTFQQTALVRGVITDFLTGAAVPRASVVFESAARKETVLSGKDGSYEAQLPVDIYRISVQRMTYCSLRRAAVHLESSEIRFNFILTPCAVEEVGILTDGRYSGEAAFEVSQFHYDSLRVPPAKGDNGELLLAFGTKGEDQQSINYNGPRIKYLLRDRIKKDTQEAYKFMPVMLTYGSHTIYGDTVKLTKVGFEISVVGNVSVEDGHTRTQANAVRIRFAGDKLIVEFIR
jgi:hypothetical protein